MEHTAPEELFAQIRECTKLTFRLAQRGHPGTAPTYHRSGIGRGQGLVLRVLAQQDGLTHSELAEKLDIRPSSLGELVAKLEESGYVERRQNESDRRISNVFLTEKGRESEKAFVSPRREAAEKWSAGLTEDEKSQLTGLLGKLNGSLRRMLEETGGAAHECGHFGGCRGPEWGGWGHRGPAHHHGEHDHGGPEDCDRCGR